ncbi:Ppx/GppA family phosphatase [Alkalibacter sp. M17DMB]|nr:Ppx/GppA family phosphatase [Alkalibacter mobilis]
MICASIDIGTNSTRLMVAKVENGKISNKKKWVFYTRMGEGLGKDSVITEKAMKRNLDALYKAKAICDGSGVEVIWAFGTSALRDAKNSQDFIREALMRTGIEVEILTGERESEYGFLGVSQSFEEKNILIVDLGGGSCEFIAVRNGEKVFAQSIDVGAVRLKEMFIGTYPADHSALAALKGHVVKNLEKTFKKNDMVDLTLVGIGGTITSISSMNQGLECYDSEKIDKSVVKLSEIDDIYNGLVGLEIDEIKKIKGLEEKRADIILPGILIIKTLMEYGDFQSITVSDSDNLEGAIAYKIK